MPFTDSIIRRYRLIAAYTCRKSGLMANLCGGPEGKAVVAMQDERSVGYATVQNATGTDVAVFYQTK